MKSLIFLMCVHYSHSRLFFNESDAIFNEPITEVLNGVLNQLSVNNGAYVLLEENLDVILPSSLSFYLISDYENDTSVLDFHERIVIIFTGKEPVYYFEKYNGAPKQTKSFIFYNHLCFSGENITDTFRKGWTYGILVLSIITQCDTTTYVYLFEKKMLPTVCKDGFRLKLYQFSTVYTSSTNETYINLDVPEFCTLKIISFKANPFVIDVKNGTGMQVKMLNTIEEVWKVNMKFDHKEEFQHEIIHNGTYYALIKDLVNAKADIGLGRLMMNDTKTVPCHLGPVFYNDKAYFMGPKPQVLKVYTKLLKVFDKATWFRVLYTIIGVIIIFYIIVKALSIEKYGLMEVIFDTCCMTIGSGLSYTSEKITFRILVIFYLLFCLNMDGIYVGKLSSIFAARSYGAKVDSIVQLGRQGHYVNLSMHIERLTLIMFVTRNDARGRRGVHLRYMAEDDLMKQVAYVQHNATVGFLSTYEANPYEQTLVDVFEVGSLFLSLYETFYVSRFTILGGTIKTWAQEIIERGFLVKWLKDIILDHYVFWPVQVDEEEKVILTLAHYRELCIIYLSGCLASTVALCLEFLAKWIEVNTHFVERVKYVISLLKPPIEA